MVVHRAASRGPAGRTGRASQSSYGDRLIPRLLLGRQLRFLRVSAGVSQERAARAVQGSGSKISRLERGQVGFHRRDVEALLTLYGVDDEADRSTPLALVDATKAPPWWRDHRDIVAGWARTYLSAERAAHLIRCFDDRFVPALLQTTGYARRTARLAHPGASQDELRRHVELCGQRQRIVCRRPRPVNLWAVLPDAVLWRPIADLATMRTQLEHLIELCMRPNVTLQILPSANPDLQPGGGPLTLLRFQQPGLTDLVHLHRPGQSGYPHRPAEIEQHWHRFNLLVTEAAPPEHSPHILSRILAAYRPGLTGR